MGFLMSSSTFAMAMGEKTLTGNNRLALMAFGDCHGACGPATVAEWCNCSEAEALAVLLELERRGFLRFGIPERYCGSWHSFDYPGWYQPEMVEWLVEREIDSAASRQEGAPAFSSTKHAYIPKHLREQIYDRDGHRCIYCGSQHILTIDHQLPRVRGGDNDPDNLATVCRTCNVRKGTRTHGEFVEWLSEQEAAQ